METSCADPVDQHLSDITLAARGEDCGVTRVVVNNEQEVALVTLSTDAGGAPHVHVKRLQRGLYRRKLGGVRGSPLPSLDTGDAGARTSTPTSLACSVPLSKLLRGGDVTSALLLLLLLALTTTGAYPLRRATPTSSTSSVTASSTAATSATSAPTATTAASASTAASDTSTPATTPTATPTPSAASTAASTAPASSCHNPNH
ncbi:unnamed protein product [Closterium sp. NIES-64]|nr:unnamed protein product [Closterium sp. NIES-64]